MAQFSKQDVYHVITITPGIRALSNVDETQKPIALKDSAFENGILIEETTFGPIITIALITDIDINVHEITRELKDNFIRKIGKDNFEKLKIVIRGVK